MPMGAPGVTQPLTPDQIARENPPNALSGSAVDKPVVLKGMGGMSIRVVKLAEGLSHPDGLVFLPDGHTMLITERVGRLRVVKDGVLDTGARAPGALFAGLRRGYRARAAA